VPAVIHGSTQPKPRSSNATWCQITLHTCSRLPIDKNIVTLESCGGVNGRKSVVWDPVAVVSRSQFTKHQEYNVDNPPDTDAAECQQFANSRTYTATNVHADFTKEMLSTHLDVNVNILAAKLC